MEIKSSRYINSEFRKEALPSYEILFEYCNGNLACFISKENKLLFFDTFIWNYTDLVKELSNLDNIFKSFDFFEPATENFQISLSYKSSGFTLIPQELYDPENKIDFLNFLLQEKQLFVGETPLKSMKAISIFPFQNEILEFFMQKFSNVNLTHSTALWLDKFLADSKIGQELIAVRVNNSFIELAYIYNKTLKLANIYGFETAEDLMFYILSITQQYRINRERCELIVGGFILQDSKIFALFQKYFSNVYFQKANDKLAIGNELQHTYFPHFSHLT